MPCGSDCAHLRRRAPARTNNLVRLRRRFSVVTVLSAGADWNVNENLAFGTELHLSPRSTQYAGTQVSLRQANGTETSADALVRSQTSQTGAAFSTSFDTAGESALEWSYGAN